MCYRPAYRRVRFIFSNMFTSLAMCYFVPSHVFPFYTTSKTCFSNSSKGVPSENISMKRCTFKVICAIVRKMYCLIVYRNTFKKILKYVIVFIIKSVTIGKTKHLILRVFNQSFHKSNSPQKLLG